MHLHGRGPLLLFNAAELPPYWQTVCMKLGLNTTRGTELQNECVPACRPTYLPSMPPRRFPPAPTYLPSALSSQVGLPTTCMKKQKC